MVNLGVFMKRIFIIIFVFISFFVASFSLAQNRDYWGLNTAASLKTNKDAFRVEEVRGSPGDYISARAGLIIGSILSFMAVIFMILIIYGGILWMTARGNNQQTEKAQNLIIQAVVGLIIVLSAYTITRFIGNVFTKSDSSGLTEEISDENT